MNEDAGRIAVVATHEGSGRRTGQLCREYAYIDGRAPNARPPLTVMNINLWDQPDRRKALARLRHGSKVRLLEAEWSRREQRLYVRVRRFFRSGWVPLRFLSAERHAPIGDHFEGRGRGFAF